MGGDAKKSPRDPRHQSAADREHERLILIQFVIEESHGLPLRRVCDALGVSRATIYRRLQGIPISNGSS
ncbi:MAG: helix-turn-helix domain-containing protein [Myxococcales bacterium]